MDSRNGAREQKEIGRREPAHVEGSMKIEAKEDASTSRTPSAGLTMGV